MRAGIIAAGWGERLGQKIPKALTPVRGRALIDYTLDGMEAAGIKSVTCIVNEAARAVPEYVDRSRRSLKMDWIVQTTPSSMHSFLIVLERLASAADNSQPNVSRRGTEESFLITTVDSICPLSGYRDFLAASNYWPDADVCLGLTKFVDDEKPLRVAMRGEEGTGLMPQHVADRPSAWEIVAMTTNGFESEFVTAGFYRASPRILKEKDKAFAGSFTALRQFLGYLLKYGYRIYGVPLPSVIDIDRPEDVRTAEKALKGFQTR